MRMATPNLRAMFIFAAAIASLGSVSIRAGPWRDTLLPAGFLSTRGSQIIGINGVPVRIASVGLTGMNVVGGRLQLEGPFKGFTEDIAPVWVGEFGTTNSPRAIQSNEPGSQGQWFSALVDFLGKEKQISWTYWAVNGEDDLGVLGNSYDPAPASSLKQKELQSIQFPLNELGKSNRAAIASGE